MMSDLRYADVVETNTMIGPDGEYAVSICKTCSERHKATKHNFTHPSLRRLVDGDFQEFVPDKVTKEFLAYVTGIRAWTCCHHGQEPLDGFPESPETPRGFELEEIN